MVCGIDALLVWGVEQFDGNLSFDSHHRSSDTDLFLGDLFWRHSDAAVEPELMCVDIAVTGDLDDQRGKLFWMTQSLGEGD